LAELKRLRATKHGGPVGKSFWGPVDGCDRSKRGWKGAFPRKDKMFDHLERVHGDVVGETGWSRLEKGQVLEREIDETNMTATSNSEWITAASISSTRRARWATNTLLSVLLTSNLPPSYLLLFLRLFLIGVVFVTAPVIHACACARVISGFPFLRIACNRHRLLLCHVISYADGGRELELAPTDPSSTQFQSYAIRRRYG
jgi:hypothetical protein